MKRVSALVSAAIIVSVVPVAAQNARLSVDLDLLPAPTEKGDYQVAGSRGDNLPLKFVRAGNEWRTDVRVGKSSSVKLDLRLDGRVPQGYVARSLRVIIPYQPQHQAVDVRVIATLVDGSASEARQLNARGFNYLGARDLLAEYQRAWAISSYRRARRGNDWPNLHDYDIQAVYKYLEAAILVAKKTFVVPDYDGEIAQAQQWLADAYRAKQARVIDALDGKRELYESVVRDIEALRARAVTRVWPAILATNDLATQCVLLKEFDAEFAELGGGVHDGLTQAHVLNAWSACLAKLSGDASVASNPEFFKEMNEVSAKLAFTVANLNDSSLKTRTLSHHASLNAIIAAKREQF